ncbi:MAG: DUF1360 domain-containing protein [Parcubacteria group bacterium]
MPKLIEKDQDLWHFVSSIVFISLVILLTYYLEITGKIRYNISAFDSFILILATFRLVRLLTYDSVTDYIRKYLGQFPTGLRKNLSDLINCPWCTGIWMSLITIFLYLAVPYSWTFLLIMALAGAGTFIQITIWKIGLENNK